MAVRKGFHPGMISEKDPGPHPLCWSSPYAYTNGVPPETEPDWEKVDGISREDVKMAKAYTTVRAKCGACLRCVVGGICPLYQILSLPYHYW